MGHIYYGLNSLDCVFEAKNLNINKISVFLLIPLIVGTEHIATIRDISNSSHRNGDARVWHLHPSGTLSSPLLLSHWFTFISVFLPFIIIRQDITLLFHMFI